MAIDPLSTNGTLNGAQGAPPSGTPSGTYLVTSPASGAWAGQAGKIAAAAGPSWTFSTPVVDWVTTLALLPKVANNTWGTNFGSWYSDRIQNITTDPTALNVAAGFVFTFNVSTFSTALQAMAPTTSASAGITSFANAWQSALLASTVVVSPNAFVPPPGNPATLFSIVATSAIDVASITAGKAKLLELISAPPTANALTSQFATKFREATLLLTITVAGTNNASPTPSPLTVPLVPLI